MFEMFEHCKNHRITLLKIENSKIKFEQIIESIYACLFCPVYFNNSIVCLSSINGFIYYPFGIFKNFLHDPPCHCHLKCIILHVKMITQLSRQ